MIKFPADPRVEWPYVVGRDLLNLASDCLRELKNQRPHMPAVRHFT